MINNTINTRLKAATIQLFGNSQLFNKTNVSKKFCIKVDLILIYGVLVTILIFGKHILTQ